MAGRRLTISDKRALVLWVIAGILGAVFAQKYFFRAFPEASVNFQVSREEAQARAQKFVTGLGENVSGYQSTIVFQVDDNAKVYLERQVGLQEANRLMSSELNIWFWEVRFFQPQQEEEFRVNVSPAGQIVGYNHIVEKNRAGATLDRGAAQSAAQNYLATKLGLDLSGWDFLPEEANSTKRTNRLDWSFTWEKHGFRAKDAPYRLRVGVEGDRAGSSEEFLKVPEAWERSYAHLRAGNDFLTLVTFLPYVLLLGAAVWMGITLTRQGRVTWGTAIKLGLVVAAVLTLMQLNEWPIQRAGYNTNSSYGNFVFQQIATAILFGLASALTVSLVYPAGEAIYRATQPGRLQLSKVLTLRGLRSQEFFSAAIVGLSLTALALGFVVAFYMVGSRYGVWAPQELNYTNSVSTVFPWIEGVAIGLLASTNEEFTFRMFAIPLVERITGSRWLAVILPAFCWSFLHANYPQEPPYIRGIEIGIMGLATGLVMLRWGILATLIWHYTFDAAQVGLLLIRSNSLYFKISGVVVGAAVLAPLAFACVSFLTRGHFEEDEDLLNRSAPKPELALAEASPSAEGATSSRRYDALTPAKIGFLVVCLLVGGVLTWRLKPASVGDYLKLSINARAARAGGDKAMRGRGLDPNSYYHSTVLHDATDPLANEFLRERIGVAGLNTIYANRVPGALWLVRYFRDSQPEEFAVILKPDGSIHSLRHTLAEETLGASLTKEEAVARAGKFLREEKQIDLNNWTLVESNSDKRPHRTDHTLIWEEKAALDSAEGPSAASGDHAHARIEMQVLGDEASNYRTFIKIPDDWRRKQGEATLARTVFSYSVPILLFAGLGLAAVIVYLKDLKSEAARAIPWRKIALWSVWGLGGYLVVFAAGNRIPNVLNAYQTMVPLKATIGVLGIGIVIGAPFYFGAITLLFGLAWYYARREFGEAALTDFTGMPSAYYRDALWIGLGGAAGLLGLERLLVTLSTYWPTMHRELDASFGQEFDAYLPGASIVGGAVLRGLFYTGLVAVISTFIASRLRQPWRLLLLLTGALALAGGGWGSPADLGKQFLARLILLVVVVFGVRSIMRFNILGCFLVVAGTSLVGGAFELVAQPEPFYRANGYAVVLALCLLLAWPLTAWRVRRSANPA